MERVDQQVAVDDGGVESIAALEARHLAVPLEELALKARSDEQATEELNQALRTLLPTEANGTALLKLLDEGVLADLRTTDGTSSRILGVEALLRLGYPWAVHIQPEELEWYRETLATARNRRLLILLASFAVAAGSALYLLQYFGF